MVEAERYWTLIPTAILFQVVLEYNLENIRKEGYDWPSVRPGDLYWDHISVDRYIIYSEKQFRDILNDLGEAAVKRLLSYYFYDAISIAFLCVLLFHLITIAFERILTPDSILHWIDVLPFVGGIADFLENFILFCSVLTYPAVYYPLILYANFFTWIKIVCYTVSGVIGVVGCVGIMAYTFINKTPKPPRSLKHTAKNSRPLPPKAKTRRRS